jgi:pimeloyl-ACP methyl ester carboxylesterase
MDIISVTDEHDTDSYQKVVIMLHGGGMNGEMWRQRIESGWFGEDLTGFKYVFPTSALEGHVWYDDIKDPNCGYCDDCAYDIDTIASSGEAIR